MGLMSVLPLAAKALRLSRARGRRMAGFAALPTAAALLAGLTAAAIAAPLPEPDDMSYLRACSAYGDGYFAVPGFDTCLRISGHARGDVYGGGSVYARTIGSRRYKSYSQLGRGVVEFSTMSDTKYGPLHTYIKFGDTWQDGAAATFSNDLNGGNGQLGFAYIELGGLRVGLDETIFAYWTGYYGDVMNDSVLNPAQTRTNVLSYTFNLPNGFSAIIGAEQGNTAGADNISYFNGETGQFTQTNQPGGFRFGRDGRQIYRKLSTETKNYLPNLLAGVKYEQKWGTIAAVLAYDAYNSELAAKMRLDVNITDKISVFAMGGYKTMGDYYNYDTSYGDNGARLITAHGSTGAPAYRLGIYRQVNSLYGDWGGHAIAWLGSSYQLNPKTSLNLEQAYDTSRNFYATTNMTHIIANGLTLSTELSFINWGDRTSHRTAGGTIYSAPLRGKNAVQGSLRFNKEF